MRYYNADGGEAEMCGNGARCFARFAERTAGAKKKISFETPAGIIRAKVDGEMVCLQMSEPKDLRSDVEISAGGEKFRGHSIDTGVPHFVIFVDKIDDVDVVKNGRAVRRHEIFSPRGTNVNFVEKRGRRRIAIRTYERGVEDETLACGTGVVASALTFALSENVDGPIGVLVRGGRELTVGFKRSGEQFSNVTLTGPADFVFEGTIESSSVAGCLDFARHDKAEASLQFNVSRHFYCTGYTISRWRDRYCRARAIDRDADRVGYHRSCCRWHDRRITNAIA